MTVIALVSAKGSPGVTTAALALTAVWPRPVLLAECDPAGGDVTAGYLQAQAPLTGGLLGLATALHRRPDTTSLHDFTVPLNDAGDQQLLSGLRDPAQAVTLTPLWPSLTDLFHSLDTDEPCTDVLADLGRLTTSTDPHPLLRRADLVVMLLRPTLPAVSAAQPRLAWLRSALTAATGGSDQLRLLLVGEAPYRARDVAGVLETSVVGVLADDRSAAAVFSGDRPASRGLARSPLLRSARTVSQHLLEETSRYVNRRTPEAPNGHRPEVAVR